MHNNGLTVTSSTTGGNLLSDLLKGDKHQVPSHSTRGQKRTARDRYKLPVGLLKRITLPYRPPLEPLDSQGNKGKISTGVFFNAKTSVF